MRRLQTDQPITADAARNSAILRTCPHYGACGGCTDIAAKDDRLPAALRLAGFADAVIAQMDVSPPGARRRMDLGLRRSAAGVEMGLHGHRSRDIADLHSCLVLRPELVALFDPLREVLNRLDLLRRSGSVIANLVDNGIDLLLRTDAPAQPHDRSKLAAFAEAHGICRISNAIGPAAPETLAALRAPRVLFSGISVSPPPGAFLQATVQGQDAIVAAVRAGMPGKLSRRDRIAELYAGCGTLTFALVEYARVDAFEGDAAAIAALDRACRDASLLGRITPHHRDLVRQPLMARELADYKVLVLDPPAAGASLQISEAARSTLRHVIYVSCDPTTLARDAAMLRQAGFTLIAATPIDQFIGAPQVESVCVFRRVGR